MEYICLVCKQTFDEEDIKQVDEYMGECCGMSVYEKFSVCPFCESEDIEEAYYCKACNEPMIRNDDYFLCEGCQNEFEERTMLFIKDMQEIFGLDEIETISNLYDYLGGKIDD